MGERVDVPFCVRPSWRKWLTSEERADMGKIRNYFDAAGEWTGANLGITISPVRVREHTRRSRKRDARWAARNGCIVDASGIIRDQP